LNNQDNQDHEYAILASLREHDGKRPVLQRDLARVVGISLGMTNIILKKLAQKGWVIVRRINSRNIKYAVTPSGIEELASRSYQFLKKTVRNVVFYKEILESFLLEAQKKGFAGVVLAGKSDFDFILAYLCQEHGLRFTQTDGPLDQEGSVLVLSEDFQYATQQNGGKTKGKGISLKEILTGL
jgi:DNA-binding MarR family transcriptional regulator